MPETAPKNIEVAKRNLLIKQSQDGPALSEKKKPVDFRIRKSPSGALIRKSFIKTPAPRDDLV